MGTNQSHTNDRSRLRIEISLPEPYRRQREAASDLMTRLQGAVVGEDTEVVQSGWAGRRSVGELAPWFILIVTLAQAAGREVGVGFLQAVGARSVETIKRLVLLLSQRPEGKSVPEITLELRSTFQRGDEETTQEVRLSVPRWKGDEPEALLGQVLEQGFVRADELMQSDISEWIVYDAKSDRWLTQDERLTAQMRRDERPKKPSAREPSET